ncbi:MAG TPA: NAD(P)H-hydrate dehydratase, partial [Armatimonadota bacterium]|nr:NAD(P)H-hydrate dehydratase [Armatimonadota bacterium]
INADRLSATRSLAADVGAVVLLKGPGTVIAAPDGEVWVNPTGNQALASGGTGDILSGMVGAFLAGGSNALSAAAAAAWYHGHAADAIAAPGRRGLLASDLLEALPALFPPA